jgi:AraC-like DNA-binding protein
MRATPELTRHGLSAARAGSMEMSHPHLHPEVELNLLLAGAARYATATGPLTLPAGRLAAFWGGLPHRSVAPGPVDVLIVTVPLGDVVGRAHLAPLARALLRGAVVLGAPEEGPHDAFLLGRWADELRAGAPPALVDACRAELHARLARLALAAPRAQATPSPSTTAAERLLAAVAEGYTQPTSVAELARSAGVHPTHAARTFTETFGMPLWEYATRLRVAHAVRLLRATDVPVDRVGLESGFASRSSFYRAFARLTGSSPAALRARVGGGDPL